MFVCVQCTEQVPASFSSRQTPSAHWGGFPNNPIVKTGEMRNMATQQTNHARLFFVPFKMKNRSHNLKDNT